MFDINEMIGALLRKAEMEGSYKKFYTKLIKNIVRMELTGSENTLEIFGDVGG